MGDTAAYKQQSGAGAGRRKGGPGGNAAMLFLYLESPPPPPASPATIPETPKETFPSLTRVPNVQTPPPPASCDFDTVAWRGQLSMTVTLQPSEDGARRSQPAPETPATQCGHSHGLQGMLGSCQLLTPEDNLAHTWIPVWCWL